MPSAVMLWKHFMCNKTVELASLALTQGRKSAQVQGDLAKNKNGFE